jgi:uncharacterized membrane protein YqjE
MLENPPKSFKIITKNHQIELNYSWARSMFFGRLLIMGLKLVAFYFLGMIAIFILFIVLFNSGWEPEIIYTMVLILVAAACLWELYRALCFLINKNTIIFSANDIYILEYRFILGKKEHYIPFEQIQSIYLTHSNIQFEQSIILKTSNKQLKLKGFSPNSSRILLLKKLLDYTKEHQKIPLQLDQRNNEAAKEGT